METETSENRTKKRHIWKQGNTCKICGVYRIKETHPNNKNWTVFKYYHPDTGEEFNKIYCINQQLELKL